MKKGFRVYVGGLQKFWVALDKLPYFGQMVHDIDMEA